MKLQDSGNQLDRRSFMHVGTLVGTGLLVPATLVAEQRAGARGGAEPEEDVAPPEDLMREHGVLKRVLLVYEEAIRRIDGKKDVPVDAVKNGAEIIRTFIEDYHEKLEEDYLFPRFEKAGKLADLTKVLREQHQAGRRVTEQITQLATAQTLKNPSSATKMKDLMRQFVRMYEPHEAREDASIEKSLGIYELAQFTPHG